MYIYRPTDNGLWPILISNASDNLFPLIFVPTKKTVTAICFRIYLKTKACFSRMTALCFHFHTISKESSYPCLPLSYYKLHKIDPAGLNCCLFRLMKMVSYNTVGVISSCTWHKCRTGYAQKTPFSTYLREYDYMGISIMGQLVMWRHILGVWNICLKRIQVCI